MTLDRVKKGQSVKILSISDGLMRIQAIRFGFAEGAVINCEEVIPAGPIVIRRCGQQVALGRQMAGKIDVAIN